MESQYFPMMNGIFAKPDEAADGSSENKTVAAFRRESGRSSPLRKAKKLTQLRYCPFCSDFHSPNDCDKKK